MCLSGHGIIRDVVVGAGALPRSGRARLADTDPGFFRFRLFGDVFLTFSRVFDGFPQKPFVPRLNHFNWLPPPDGFLLGPLHFPSRWWWTHRRLAGQPA